METISSSIHRLQFLANDNEPVALRVHLEPIIRIQDGAWDGVSAFFAGEFEDWSAGQCPDMALSADDWLALAIEQAGRAIIVSGLEERPVCMSVPYMAMMHAKAPQAALRGAKRSGISPSEFRLEFSDAALIMAGTQARSKLAGFARAGFRLGLDARAGWQTHPDSPSLKYMDAARLDAHGLDLIDPSAQRLQEFAQQGWALYAENSLWPGGRILRQWGVSGVVAPYRASRQAPQSRIMMDETGSDPI